MQKFTLACWMLAAPAYAHVPYVEGLDYSDNEAFIIQSPIEKSHALYASFNSPTDQDRVVFTLTEQDLTDDKIIWNEGGQSGRLVSFNTIVPACAPYALILPAVALIGPRQTVLSELALGVELPFTVDADQGIYFMSNTVQGPIFEEKISGTAYFQQKKAEFIVSAPGRYEIVVWEPAGQIGDYVLVVGGEEMFGVNDVVQSIKRLRYLRKGMEIKDEYCRQLLKS